MDQFLALKASAGSGKTFALTARYISLLVLGVNPKEILTLTFTNKAVKQMQDKIAYVVFNLDKEKDFLNEISKITGLVEEEILKKDIKSIFLNENLNILTIDKFINKLLREFSGYVNLSDDFKIEFLDKEEFFIKYLDKIDTDIFIRLVDIAFSSNKKIDSLFNIFEELYLIDENINKFYSNIKYQDIKKLEEDILDLANQLKKEFYNFKLTKSAENALDFDSFEDLLKKTWLEKDSLEEYRFFKKYNLDNYIFFEIKKLLKLYYEYKARYTLDRIIYLYNNYKEFRQKFISSKNKLEFNDVSKIVYEMLLNSIDKDFIYFRLDSKFSHILIDEFQDTSILQFKILEPFISEIVSSDNKTFFYVGDTKQSIYRFRGGKKELFDYVLKKYPQIKLNYLNKNYRSKKNIVEFVNNIFLKLKDYSYKEQFANNIEDKGYIEIVDFEDTKEFIEVIEKIKYLLNQGIKAKDIAILTFTNEEIDKLAKVITKTLNIPVVTDTTSKLINHINIKAIIYYIKYLYFKENYYKVAFNALLNKDYFEEIPDIEYINIKHLVKKIATKYNIFDENVVRFIEVINYVDIIDFVYNIDRLDTPILNKEKIGLNIMTIFKSKGLEFKNVFVLDKLKDDRKSYNILFEYDNIKLKNIYVDFTQKDIIKKEEELKKQDIYNTLYVAFTRAINNLFIFKKPEKSVFDILDLEYKKDLNLLVEKEKDKKQINENIEYKKLNLGIQENIIIDSKDYDINNRYFGLALHYTLEMLKEFDKKYIDEAILIAKSKYKAFLEEEDFKNIYKKIENLLDNKEFLSLVEGSYFKEKMLVYKNEIKILDLLIEQDDKYIIVDYKTSQNNKIEHKKQILYYKEAIESISNKRVEAYLVYLENNIKIKKI